MVSEALISVEQLIDDFKINKAWDKQYRLLIQLGKKLPVLHESEKIEENQVKGCESLAWLVIESTEGYYNFKMDSDTRVVKGLMMILMIIYEGKNISQITAINIETIFEQLGLLNHLSPSRANGLLAIVDKIKGISGVEKD